MAQRIHSDKPRQKVAAAGVSGAIATLVIYGFSLAGVEITPEVAAAIATLVSFVGGYFIPE